jgi:hypothetical protein
MAISDRRHLFGAREMAVERTPCAVSALVRIDVQDHPHNVAPVGALRISIKKAEVSDQVLLVVWCERWVRRGLICDIWIKGRRCIDVLAARI